MSGFLGDSTPMGSGGAGGFLAGAAGGAAAGSFFPGWGNVAGALIGGAAGIIGGNNANAANAKQAEAQMAFQREQQQIAMGFQDWTQQRAMEWNERMSNTVWQRGVNDMLRAGINPILAYSKGGATAPTIQPLSVGTGGGASARMENVLGPAFQSAMQGANYLTQLEGLKAQVENTKSQNAVLQADALLRGAQIEQTKVNTGLQLADTSHREQQIIGQFLTNKGLALMPEQVRAGIAANYGAAAASGAQAARTNQETELTRNWGRPNQLSDLATTLEAGGTRLYDLIRQNSGTISSFFRNLIPSWR